MTVIAVLVASQASAIVAEASDTSSFSALDANTVVKKAFVSLATPEAIGAESGRGKQQPSPKMPSLKLDPPPLTH